MNISDNVALDALRQLNTLVYKHHEGQRNDHEKEASRVEEEFDEFLYGQNWDTEPEVWETATDTQAFYEDDLRGLL